MLFFFANARTTAGTANATRAPSLPAMDFYLAIMDINCGTNRSSPADGILSKVLSFSFNTPIFFDQMTFGQHLDIERLTILLFCAAFGPQFRRCYVFVSIFL